MTNRLLCVVKAQAVAANATTTAPAAASSSKKSSKKASKSAKKQAKQQPHVYSPDRAAMLDAVSELQGTALEWAAVVLGLARRHEVLRAAVLEGWQLLDWLEVSGPITASRCR
jgi:hypothetical protein